MLSKNNFKERLKKMELRKERFSIRKLSVGAASVLIGFFFINSIDCQHVQAAEQEKVISESSSKIDDSTNNQKIKTNLTNINTQETSENKKTESSQNYKDMKSDDVAQKSNEKQSNSATTLNSYPNILDNKEALNQEDTDTKVYTEKNSERSNQSNPYEKYSQLKVAKNANVNSKNLIENRSEVSTVQDYTWENNVNVNNWTYQNDSQGILITGYKGNPTGNITIPNSVDWANAGILQNGGGAHINSGTMRSLASQSGVTGIAISHTKNASGQEGHIWASNSNWNSTFWQSDPNNTNHNSIGDHLIYLDLANLETSNITNMSSMFNGLQKLRSVGNLSNWNTSNVVDMSLMFTSTSILHQQLNLTWDTSKVNNMSHMFQGSGILGITGIENWNTGSLTNISCMFEDAFGLKSKKDGTVSNASYPGEDVTPYVEKLDLHKWNTSLITDMSYAFLRTRVKELNVSGWNFTPNVKYLQTFALCYPDVIIMNGINVNQSTGLVQDDFSDYNYHGINAQQVIITNIKQLLALKNTPIPNNVHLITPEQQPLTTLQQSFFESNGSNDAAAIVKNIVLENAKAWVEEKYGKDSQYYQVEYDKDKLPELPTALDWANSTLVVKHKTTTVDGSKPETIPSGVNKDELSKTITRTIVENLPSGSVSHAQSVTITRTATYDEVSHELSNFSDWTSGSWTAYPVTVPKGYSVDEVTQQVGDGAAENIQLTSGGEVPGETVTSATQNATVTISYKGNEQSVKVTFIDEDHKNAQGETTPTEVGTAVTLNGQTGQNISDFGAATTELTKLEKEGYKVIDNSGLPSSYTFTDDTDQSIIVKLGHKTTTVDGSKPETIPTKKIENNRSTLPKTGENKSSEVLIVLGLIMSGVSSLLHLFDSEINRKKF